MPERTRRIYDDGDIEEADVGTTVPPVYDVPPSEWTSEPMSIRSALLGALDGIAAEVTREAEGRPVDYYEYLKSEKWAIIRRIVRRRAQNRCERCGAQRIQLNVHHLTYDRLGAEDLSDLVCLCRFCHREAHGINTASGHPYSEDN